MAQEKLKLVTNTIIGLLLVEIKERKSLKTLLKQQNAFNPLMLIASVIVSRNAYYLSALKRIQIIEGPLTFFTRNSSITRVAQTSRIIHQINASSVIAGNINTIIDI